MALNLSISDQGPQLHAAIAEEFKRRRGAVPLKSWYSLDLYDNGYILSIECNGKTASRHIPERLSIYKAVEEMIDELWPLMIEEKG